MSSSFPSLSGGSASSGASTGDVNIPPELFQFPEYPQALAAVQGYNATATISPTMIGFALLVLLLATSKKGR
jgi:hypothetical protein